MEGVAWDNLTFVKILDNLQFIIWTSASILYKMF